jgi:Skp family chaperone for outer membrane proteins
MQSELKSLTDLIAVRSQELAKVEAHLAQLQKDTKAKQAKLQRDFEDKRKELSVKIGEVEEVAKLKAGLGKQGLDIPTFLGLVKEYSHGSP